MKIKYIENLNKENIIAIFLHHSAVSYMKNPDQWNATNNYHKKIYKKYEKVWKEYKSSLGFYNGYNIEIAMNGTRRQARKIGETTAAVYQKGMNDGRAVHIILDGCFDMEYPTKDQENELKKTIVEIMAVCKNAKIEYHRWFANKTCPGKLIKDDWAKNLISNDKNMRYVIDETKEQYLLYDELKIAFNIGDPKELKKLQEKGLEGQPANVSNSYIDGYTIYPCFDKQRGAEEIKKLRDLLGL